MIEDFELDPSVTHLNHGAFGSAPRTVLAFQEQLRSAARANPTAFMETFDVQPALAASCPLLGSNPDNTAFVDNATTGVASVLASFPFRPGDEVLATTHTYPGVQGALRGLQATHEVRVVTAAVPFPLADEQQILDAVDAALGPRVVLAIIDHISSGTAIVMPVKRIAELCRDAGVSVLVDGAHAPFHIPVDVHQLCIDYYTGNLHKWAFAPRPCGLLWVRPELRDSVWPAVGSLEHRTEWHRAFHWPGTHDPTAWMASLDAARFRARHPDIPARNRALAHDAAGLLQAAWDVPASVPAALRAAMATVRLPSRWGATADDAARLKLRLREEHRIETTVFAHDGCLWTRVSAQVYNRLDDYQRLAEALA